jgi:hypothetical protein
VARSFGAAALGAVLFALPGGCYDEPSPEGYCSTITERYRECGLLDGGRYECVNYGDDTERCETECYAAASCRSIVDLWCADADGAVRGGPLVDCLSECFGTTAFECDGNKELVGLVRCNGTEDCDDGTDEADCEEVGYLCRDGERRIDNALFCDGNEDCDDASDEPSDCVSELTCDGDFDVPKFMVCDGIQHCDDGADEPADCATLVCVI